MRSSKFLQNIRFVKPGEEPKNLWNLSFLMILMFGFISGTAGQMVNPQLSEYAIGLGASLSLAGTIMGLQSGMALFLRPISGAVNDVLNRKWVMVAGILMSSVAYVGYMVVPTIWGTIVFRVIQGFSFAFMSVARTSLATEFIPKERLGEGVALTSFGFVLSQAVGPGLGLWLTDQFGYGTCFMISNALCIVGAVVISLVPYKHEKHVFRLKKLKFANLLALEVLPYAFLGGLFSMSNQLESGFLELISIERVIPGIAIYFTVYSLIALAMRPFAGKILDKRGLSVLIYPAYIFNALTFFLLGAAHSLFLIVLAGVCKAMSQGLVLVCIQGSAIKRLGRERAGVAVATIMMGQDLINFAAPAVGGVLATNMGYANMFYCFSVFTLIGIPFYAWIHHHEKKHDTALAQTKLEPVA